HQRTRETMHGLGFGGVPGAGDIDAFAFDLDGRAWREGELELALRAFHGAVTTLDLHLDLGGDGDGLFANSRHRLSRSKNYQTRHSTSPPTFCLRACVAVITPREVVRIATPKPPRTRGASLPFTYRRRPGRLTRWMPSMTPR